MNPILLDTHAAVWAVEGRLKKDASRAIDAAAERGELLLSPITAWEIGMLERKQRLSLEMRLEDYVRALFDQTGVVLAALTPSIALAAAMLPDKPISDPADRILIATAAAYGAQLVTRDKRIAEYAKSTGHIRCVPC